ncbi:helix-turn-helix domain-containing protein [Lachnospiraceae bacterium]|uniref:helix-turn-helix domain-containing protein n=1 Tax=Eubacterium sp. MSJ-33 TaxID=2841528 RepID=UPI0015AE1470|nr:helix-turn-helix domain-containing protein [Eubacterium sp. MSJ-33]
MQDRAFYERIGAKFQRERERQRITREHMAEQINISSKFLYEIESGRKGFSCEIFNNMCKYLHVNADFILAEDEVTGNRFRIETMTRDFSAEEMNYLAKMIDGIREMRRAYGLDDKTN